MNKEPITELLKNWPEIKAAWLFGSVAKGTATEKSDIDIAIYTRQPLDTEKHIELVEELALLTGRAVDLIDLKRAGEPLLGEILKKGVQLFGSQEIYAALIKQHIYDTADFLPYAERILAERREKWINS